MKEDHKGKIHKREAKNGACLTAVQGICLTEALLDGFFMVASASRETRSSSREARIRVHFFL